MTTSDIRGCLSYAQITSGASKRKEARSGQILNVAGCGARPVAVPVPRGVLAAVKHEVPLLSRLLLSDLMTHPPSPLVRRAFLSSPRSA
jgi:hypothetical protein